MGQARTTQRCRGFPAEGDAPDVTRGPPAMALQRCMGGVHDDLVTSDGHCLRGANVNAELARAHHSLVLDCTNGNAAVIVTLLKAARARIR